MRISTGRLLTAHARDTNADFDAFALRTGENSWLLLDPEKELQAQTRADIGIGNAHGCFLGAAGKKAGRTASIDTGPWTRYCVSKLP